MTHHCHACGCDRSVPPKMLMCIIHWRMVPRDLQAGVWATYRAGQEDDKRPSSKYLIASGLAVKAVAEREGKLNLWAAERERYVHTIKTLRAAGR